MSNIKFKLPGHFVKITHETEAHGIFYGEDLYIKEVIYQNPATIVFWSDNTKTVSKCSELDNYSREVGLMVCIMKKIYGNVRFKELLEYFAIPEAKRVNLNDVRHAINVNNKKVAAENKITWTTEEINLN